MAVTYYNFEQNTVDLPTVGAASTYTRGFNAVGGTIQSLLIRMQLTGVAGAGFRTLSAIARYRER